MYNYIACFDLDKTILSVNSAAILIRQAHRNKIMSTKDLVNAYYLSFIYKLRSMHAIKIIEKMASWLNGISESTITKLSTDIVQNHLLQTIRPEIYAELKLHKDREAGIVILSSSMLSICSPIAQYLGFDDIICSEFEVQNGLYTGRPMGRFCFGEEKLTRLDEYCRKNNYHIEDAWYYADSIWDKAVLASVGHPVCVNPDKKLRKVAADKGWAVREFGKKCMRCHLLKDGIS